MNPIEKYIQGRDKQVRKNIKNLSDYTYGYVQGRVEDFTKYLVITNYVKNFTWMGIPILQYPTDLMVMQEIIWKVRPDFIIETGVAFGGMTKFYADMLDMIFGTHITPSVLGIDIDIRQHTRDAIEGNLRIDLLKGSSISLATAANVKCAIKDGDRVLVSLDSCHSHAHVLKELELYAPLVSVGSYIVVFDTAIEFYGHLDKNQDRPWGEGNNPWTAVQEFLKTDMGRNFVIDKELEQRALITSAIDGWLRRTR